MAALDPIKKAAVYAMSLADNADDVARVVDDWGWKGGKPGEITGGEYMKRVEAGYGRAEKLRTMMEAQGMDEGRVAEAYYRELDANVGALNKELAKQLRKSKDPYYRTIGEHGSDSDLVDLMRSFRTLEQAGVPRKWTGKVARKLPFDAWNKYPALSEFALSATGPFSYSGAANKLSKAMETMSDEDINTFLALLPEWSGSLDELADAARSL
jgi:hypothetical protein